MHHKARDKTRKAKESHMLYGHHAVKAALTNPQRTHKTLYFTPNNKQFLEMDISHHPDMHIVETPNATLGKMLPPDSVHQGVCLETSPLVAPSLADILATGKPLIVLDQITDPRNVGAILRAAAVFDAGGLIMTRHNSPPLDGALAKAASGALEVVPIFHASNLRRTLNDIKQAGFLVAGMDEAGTYRIGDIDKTRPIACVMGAEGRGLRRLTRETCDILMRLPHKNTHAFTTLNVATAAAISLYALSV